MKLTDLELLAALENLRIRHENDKVQNNDSILRIAEAIVALNFGYQSRADWTEKLKNAELVEYEICDNIGAAEINYKRLMQKLDM